MKPEHVGELEFLNESEREPPLEGTDAEPADAGAADAILTLDVGSGEAAPREDTEETLEDEGEAEADPGEDGEETNSEDDDGLPG
ncbi:hypothetical protein R1flu_021206 [Riccia fluitans]|uniref:Uncharacterized protein n=1 Tax=Riccia fluitans TaxID=41844 RepID=A0ABD1ZNP8_9MARC